MPKCAPPAEVASDSACTSLFNVLEFPATQIPAGFDRQGLPRGVQVIGRRGNDHLTIGAAQVLERALGGWLMAHPRTDATAVKAAFTARAEGWLDGRYA